MPLHGIDVSHHQGLVGWDAVARSGKTFAFIKATEGTGFRDTRFVQNWPGAAAAGLVRGAYHFLRTSDPRAQARHYVATVGDFSSSIAILDVERSAGGEEPQIGHVREFVSEFRQLVPNHAIVLYTGRWYWVGEMGNPYGADLGPLWHSEYESGWETGPDLDRYGGWTGATFWQWTSTGTCPGVSGSVDLNVFYGTVQDLLALTGTTGKDWFDMATREELADEIRKQGPWLGQVDGDPSGALFIFHGGNRTWMASMEAVAVQRDYFRNLHTDGGKPFTPTLLEAKGFHLVNREALEAHLGAPYEF